MTKHFYSVEFFCVPALVVGFILTLSNYCFTAALLAFFLAGSKATKLRPSHKVKIYGDYKEGG